MNADYYYTDSFYFDPNEQFKQGSYGLLNLRAGWVAPGGKVSVAAFWTNVTDEHYVATRGWGLCHPADVRHAAVVRAHARIQVLDPGFPGKAQDACRCSEIVTAKGVRAISCTVWLTMP